MLLKGSCHCCRVRFQLRSPHPYPYQRCYCSICRKTQGGGGYAVNISGDASTLKVTGKQHTRIYHARIKNPGDKRAHASTSERHFCTKCGSALWLFSPEWPELVHPFASAIDSKLPVPPQRTHLMLAFKAPWVEVETKRGDKKHRLWPKEAIAEWHKRLGVAKRS